jgi:hypothetical protein
MRDNLVFSGIPENDGETDTDIRNTLQNIFINDLGLEGSNISISHCHRIVKRRNQDTRDIIARFIYYNERQQVLYNAKKLKNHVPPIYINEQFPAEIENHRNILRPLVKQAKIHNLKASLSRDKLIVNGHSYTVDTMSSVPFDTAPLHTKITEHNVFFNGRLSPYSNFFKCQFTVENINYCCVEQFYQPNPCMPMLMKPLPISCLAQTPGR